MPAKLRLVMVAIAVNVINVLIAVCGGLRFGLRYKSICIGGNTLPYFERVQIKRNGTIDNKSAILRELATCRAAIGFQIEISSAFVIFYLLNTIRMIANIPMLRFAGSMSFTRVSLK